MVWSNLHEAERREGPNERQSETKHGPVTILMARRRPIESRGQLHLEIG